MRIPEGPTDPRTAAMELTRGVVSLFNAGAYHGERYEDVQLDMFMGLFHPEVAHHTVRKMVLDRRMARQVAQNRRFKVYGQRAMERKRAVETAGLPFSGV